MNDSLDHYQGAVADRYHAHHRKSVRTRLTTAREHQLLRQAWRLAGKPSVVLDLPCGTGRCWPAFKHTRLERLVGADNSVDMLYIARQNVLSLINTEVVHTSAFDTGFDDDAYPFTVCIRFFHHLAKPEDRRAVLAELSRITTGHLVVSLWTDGNIGSRRRAKHSTPAVEGFGQRVCRPRIEIEAEFHDAGLRIVQSASVWPGLSMWRFYLLAIGDHG